MSSVPFISEADMAATQSLWGQTRTTPCAIWRNQPVRDQWGGQTDTWVVISASDLTCRIAPVATQTSEGIAQERIEVLNRVTIALPLGTDVTEKDRIVAGGVTYEVTSEIGPRTFSLEMVLACEQIVS